ncbi:hypothetical protein [Microterricola viridarii]|uniref:Polyketide cyclase / dehydrase and lipid transport n=1 Tax=Microterricola viridarii TaxID=412690 RepID=A0A0Y0MLF9_9MICO|nr:hypothetical protein [Microterricola viridarii]AMB57909.1 hypothetical protein AWU67_02415 [Microterricola viridarii]
MPTDAPTDDRAALPPRPARHTVLRSFAGHLDAAPDAVFAAIRQRMSDLPGVWVDVAGREIVQQGTWWYRGEYRVMAEPLDEDAEPGAAAGTRVEHEIVNVAQRPHWAGPVIGRRLLAEAPYAFHSLLSEIAAELDPETETEDETDPVD